MSNTIIIDSYEDMEVPTFRTLCDGSDILDLKSTDVNKGMPNFNIIDFQFENLSFYGLDIERKANLLKSYSKYITKKYISKKFDKQILKFENYFSRIDKNNLLTCFYLNLDWLLELDFNKIDVSVTESPSIFFQLKGKSSYDLNLEIFVASNNTAYSLYNNNELILQDIQTTKEAYKILLKELDFNSESISNFTQNIPNEYEYLESFTG